MFARASYFYPVSLSNFTSRVLAFPIVKIKIGLLIHLSTYMVQI